MWHNKAIHEDTSYTTKIMTCINTYDDVQPECNIAELFYTDITTNKHFTFIYNLLLYGVLCYIYDSSLIYFLTAKARWFQLHLYVNILVFLNTISDTIKIYMDPLLGYKILPNNYASFLILSMHLYHVATFKNLSTFDYFYDIAYIGSLTIPAIYFITSNQIYLGYTACHGLPGIFEYLSLILYKHNRISLYRLRYICCISNVCVKLPLCFLCMLFNYYGFMVGLIHDNIYLTIYLNIAFYLNGTIFASLTLAGYYDMKYQLKHKTYT